MNRFFKATKTLVKKDFKDVLRNPSVLILLFLPTVFAVIYKYALNFDASGSFVLFMVTTMTFAMIPISFLATIVSEEKEKNTLRTLILSGVSAGEFIASKIFVTWVFMQSINVANFFITGSQIGKLPWFFIITSLGSICLLLIGAAVGLYCKDQMATGAIAAPIMLLLMLPSMLSTSNPLFGKIALFSPIEQVLRIYFGGGLMTALLGENAPPEMVVGSSLILSVTVVLVWTVLAALAYLVMFKKSKREN